MFTHKATHKVSVTPVSSSSMTSFLDSFLKACSEYLVRTRSFLDPNTLLHNNICSSIGSLKVIWKNLAAFEAPGLILSRSSQKKITRAKVSPIKKLRKEGSSLRR